MIQIKLTVQVLAGTKMIQVMAWRDGPALSHALLAASMTLAISLPAWSSDAPAKPEPSAGKPEASAQAEKDAKPAVTPHNHMRDGKGNWVPAKKTRKDGKKAGDAAAKAAEPAQARK